MAKLNIKSGAPSGNEHLCQRCSNGQITIGYRDSDLFVICTNSTPARLVPFQVRECTDFWDRHRPDWEAMNKLALSFSDASRKAIRGFNGAGFGLDSTIDTDDCEDREEDEAAIAK